MVARSEFGRGYFTCLLSFLNHRSRLLAIVAEYERLRKTPRLHPELWDESSAVCIWANGAADHLFELKKPPPLPKQTWLAVREYREIALDWRLNMHGLQLSLVGGNELLVSIGSLMAVSAVLTNVGLPTDLDEAVAVDQFLGIKSATKGDYNCPLDRKA